MKKTKVVKVNLTLMIQKTFIEKDESDYKSRLERIIKSFEDAGWTVNVESEDEE
jgi:hypothetical protein